MQKEPLKANSNQIQVMRFTVQKVRLCFAIQYLEKVLPLAALEKIPGSPVFLIGLLNLGGRSIPILDLGLRLGLERTRPYSLDTPILLCNHGNEEMGFIVDEIFGLSTIALDEMQMQEDLAHNTESFTGVAEIESQLYLIVNVPYLITNKFERNLNLNWDSSIINKVTSP